MDKKKERSTGEIFVGVNIFYHIFPYVLQWKDAPPESLMDTKLKCVFEMPETPPQVRN